MSLLGPDDFDLSRKERRKKLARDLSPAVRKEVERLLNHEDESETMEKLANLVGAKKAKQLLHKESKKMRD